MRPARAMCPPSRMAWQAIRLVMPSAAWICFRVLPAESMAHAVLACLGTADGSKRSISNVQTSGEDALTEWTALADETKVLETIVAPAPLLSPKKTGLLDKVKFWGK